MENVREIVNGAQLPRFTNKKISLTGFITETSHNGMSFEIRTVDNIIVKINMKRPLDKPIEGYVEVIGISNGKTVTADTFILFETKDFDERANNSLCRMLYSVPNIWATTE